MSSGSGFTKVGTEAQHFGASKNKWFQFVKKYAADHNLKYSQVIGNEKARDEYYRTVKNLKAEEKLPPPKKKSKSSKLKTFAKYQGPIPPALLAIVKSHPSILESKDEKRQPLAVTDLTSGPLVRLEAPPSTVRKPSKPRFKRTRELLGLEEPSEKKGKATGTGAPEDCNICAILEARGKPLPCSRCVHNLSGGRLSAFPPYSRKIGDPMLR